MTYYIYVIAINVRKFDREMKQQNRNITTTQLQEMHEKDFPTWVRELVRIHDVISDGLLFILMHDS